MATSINKKTGQATRWSSITEIITQLISPAVNMVLARLLASGTCEFGADGKLVVV